MTRISLDPAVHARTGLGVVELQMDEYNLDDLAGEIARTLAACQDLAQDDPLTGNDGGETALR
jgi:hypothetical protein